MNIHYIQDFSFGLGDKTHSTEFSCGKSDGKNTNLSYPGDLIQNHFYLSASAESITECDRQALVSFRTKLKYEQQISFLGGCHACIVFNKRTKNYTKLPHIQKIQIIQYPFQYQENRNVYWFSKERFFPDFKVFSSWFYMYVIWKSIVND